MTRPRWPDKQVPASSVMVGGGQDDQRGEKRQALHRHGYPHSQGARISELEIVIHRLDVSSEK